MPLTVPAPDKLTYGWGRAALSRYSKTPEQIQAEIIKALEGKISVEFKDYSQWQRVPVPQVQPPPQKVPPKPRKKLPSTRPLTGASGTSCSSLCMHPWNKKPPLVDHTDEIEARERIAILQMQIDAKQRALTQYSELRDLLKNQNKALKVDIDEVSSHAHQTVTRLLEKYESYIGASKTMKRIHAKDVIQARVDLKATSEQLQDELRYLKEQFLTLDSQLNDIQQDLQVLRTYKDKEYPVKAMRISKLGSKVEDLALEQRFERNEIERITSGESTKLENYRETKFKEILEDAANEAYESLVPAGLQHMAWHNALLQQEVDAHKKEFSKSEKEIIELKREIRELKQTPQTNVRSFVFPEAYLPKRICHPDEDVVLDIPTQKPLPF